MSLTVTTAAIDKLSGIMQEQGMADNALRIVIASGGCGCSGPQFGMGFDQKQEGDATFEFGTITFLADADTAPQLEGASIDYVDDVMQQGFSIEAPNAAAAAGGGGCACGGGGH